MRYEPARALSPLTPNPDPKSFVVAQLGQTLDGRIATVTGASRHISGSEALRHLHRLRAAVDAVVVGVGTIVADDPLLTVRLVEGRNPARVVIDSAGRIPHDARILHDGAGPVYVATAATLAAPPGTIALPLAPTPGGRIDPHALLAALAERGLRRVLIEGGADTVSRFLDAGAVDLLHVLVAPMILGSGKPCLSLRPVERLDEAMRPRTEVHLFDDGDVLFTCALRTGPEAAE